MIVALKTHNNPLNYRDMKLQLKKQYKSLIKHDIPVHPTGTM